MDLFIYQEIIYKNKPDIIIEIGTYKGGSAKYLRHLLRAIRGINTAVITIDPNNNNKIIDDNILYLKGKASDADIIQDVNFAINNKNLIYHFNEFAEPKIMVIDDGSHTYDDTLINLNIYSQLVTLGQYYIVEDTICHHGLDTGPKPGPAEAIDEFLKYCRRFLIDRTCERFGLTYNSGGFLKCIKAA